MTYEIEITFTDNEFQYLISTTPYLNKVDLKFLEETGVDLNTIMKTYSSEFFFSYF